MSCWSPHCATPRSGSATRRPARSSTRTDRRTCTRSCWRLLGCARLSAARTGHHLDELARTFDAAAEVARTPFFFSGDITAGARPVAIDGSRYLVERGDHREAVFWIIATFARCHTVLAADAPELHQARLPAFRDAVADLGVTSTDDLLRRGERVIAFLPELRRTAEKILSAGTGITG